MLAWATIDVFLWRKCSRQSKPTVNKWKCIFIPLNNFSTYEQFIVGATFTLGLSSVGSARSGNVEIQVEFRIYWS